MAELGIYLIAACFLTSAHAIFPFNNPPVFDGLPLPAPMRWISSLDVYEVRGEGFFFNATAQTCDDLEAAFDRYYRMMFEVPFERKSAAKFYQRGAKRSSTKINQLEVRIAQSCNGKPMPTLGMSEIYKLIINAGRAILNADTLWGALRGLETFSQLVYETKYESHGLWMVNQTLIEDGPRFPHRGFMLDTSRHFLEKNVILQFISAMAMVKFNVFHWHIVDDQSFPYRSRVFPDLSFKGAYEPYTHTYDHEDIAEVIEFARQRGIRVVAEFDTPGHSQSWGKGNPDLLTPCYGDDGMPDGTFGPIDPTKNSTYDFLQKLFSEVSGVFADKYLHLGGDEVSFTCWKSNPNINKFMTTIGLKPGDYGGLESYYIKRVVDIVSKIGNNYIVWQEPFDNGVKLDPNTVVNIWKNTPNATVEMGSVTGAGFKAITSACWYLNRIAYGEDWQGYYNCDPQLAPQTVVNVWKWFGGRTADEEMAVVTEAGFQAITSACWYLNIISYGEDWQAYYKCDPQRFNGTDAQKALVMGGEGCMWGEWADGTNLMARTWPRASVVAERLWSTMDTTDLDSMKVRLDVHRCRMLKRGLRADPIDPSYCRYEQQEEPPKF